MKKPVVLFISSWGLFDKDSSVRIPFIYEQIGVLSDNVDAIFVEPQFCGVVEWLTHLVRQSWFNEISSPWEKENKSVKVYRLLLPKLSTRLTRRTVYEDFEFASYWLGDLIGRKLGPIRFLHLHTILPLGGFALGLQRRLKIPFLLQEHTAPFEIHLSDSHKVKYVGRILVHASHVVMVGPGLAKRMNELFPVIKNKSSVIHEMIRTDLFPVSENKMNQYVNLVSIGSLVERKGYDILLNAVAVLRKKGLNVKLIIVGEGPDRGRLEEIMTKLELGDMVSLSGHLSKPEINKILDASNIYVHTSYRETFGIAPTEAMLKGRPVVSSICEGPEYYVNDSNGILVEVGNAEAVADGVMNIISNFHKYDVLEIRKSVSSKFGEKKFMELMLEVYAEVR